MLLSKAIRLGALLKEFATGHANGMLSEKTSCAIGAACDAVGIPVKARDRLTASVRAFPILADEAPPCPACGRTYHLSDFCWSDGRIQRLVWHLNDHHHWERERIADFIATLEQPEAGAEAVEVLEAPQAKEAVIV